MTQQTREFIENLTSLSDALQARYVALFNRLMKEDASGDGAIEEPELMEVQVPTFEDIKHLLGRGEGPGDLSYNKDYLKDLGLKSTGHNE